MSNYLNESPFLSYLDAYRKHAWIGDNAPAFGPFTTIDLFSRPGFRATCEESGAFDTVWITQNPLNIQGWRILIDSSLRLFGKKGTLVLRYIQNHHISVINLKNFLFRKYGIVTAVDEERFVNGEFVTIFQVERLNIIQHTSKVWTFGILTQGKKVELVERFCRSVRTYGGYAHQIIIVGPENAAYEAFHPTYLNKKYSEKFSDICVKKNDIVQQAKNDNICILHDRYWLNSDFFVGFEKFGYDFDFLTIRQSHESGKNYPSYCAIDDRCHLIWGQIYECGNENETWNRHYLNGGFIIGKRKLLLDIPFNPLLFHNQAEDVELAKEMEGRSIIPRLNYFSSAVTDVPDHLTDAFLFDPHSDYERVFFPAVSMPDIDLTGKDVLEVSRPDIETVSSDSDGAHEALPIVADSNPMNRQTLLEDLVDEMKRRRKTGASWKGIAFLTVQFFCRRGMDRLRSKRSIADPSLSEIAKQSAESTLVNQTPQTSLPLKPAYLAQPLEDEGMNILLYAADAGGVVNLAIYYLRGLKTRNIPFCIIDIQFAKAGLVLPEDLVPFMKDEPRYPTNVWCLGFPFIAHHISNLSSWAEGRWNINFTHWELPRIPQRLVHNFESIDSIIVDSEFVKDAIAEVTTKPITLIDPQIRIPNSTIEKYSRRHFGLPTEKVLFLLNWDFTSSTIRKNPLAGVKAFKRAFEAKGKDVALVMHVKFERRHGSEQYMEYEEFIASVKREHPDIIVLTTNNFTYEEALALKGLCDCYISLHRSEGYGMGCAETLALGRRCVMTGWSGNMELLKNPEWRERSYIVNSIPVEVAPSDFPWVEKDDEVRQFWADVKIEDAVLKLKEAYEDIVDKGAIISS